MDTKSAIVTIIVTVFASSGFWSLILWLVQQRVNKKSIEQKALMALLHDRIYEICHRMIEAGSVSTEGYKNLLALYEPYEKWGGNGTAKIMKERVEDLLLKKGEDKE